MIKLPKLFDNILKSNPVLYAAISSSFVKFEPWLEQSGMPFFPGFTDHSPRHIKDVLETAASLVADESRDLLSPEDVAVLCASILLHDCGMHLTQDGFRALVSDEGAVVIPGLGDVPWPQLWKDFLSEARRFGQEKLVAIFGDTEPLLIENFNFLDLSERDCLLIGEFVRRHHARLAHEIALRGVPNVSGERLELVGLDEELRDLAGLVARSHGMSIRATFPYIDNKYGLVAEYRSVKTPFLMAVLRIADYIQVQSERALKSLLSVKELRSPISRQEWRAHFAVKDVSMNHDDPEALYVRASPKEVRTYLKLVNLFRDIQRELDESWATIGEVYGRRGELSELGLTWRRIRSNLDAADKFSATVPYVPIKAGFDASGPDLLKLLVGPLYEYDYSVGIRELLQNAVDACRELVDITKREREFQSDGDEPDVLVEFNESQDGSGWITVTDRGVGMTLNTITNYFLIAGASFRNSDVWKKQHLSEDGESRVLRGGRFGVGALAAFLLGDQITVKTRHFERLETEGFEFTARMDDPLVEVKRCTAPAGTSIRVWVSNKDVFDALRPSLGSSSNEDIVHLRSWSEVDWFVQESPAVKYLWNGYATSLSRATSSERKKIQACYRPSANSLVPLPEASLADWHVLDAPAPYSVILWRFLEKNPARSNDDAHQYSSHIKSSQITVNGIRVESIGYGRYEYIYSNAYRVNDEPAVVVRRPSMAIFDPSGLCPINLQRSSIAFEKMGFDTKLTEAIFRDHFYEIVGLLRECKSIDNFVAVCQKLGKFPGIVYDGFLLPVGATRNGFVLVAPHIIKEVGIKYVYFVDFLDGSKISEFRNLLKDDEMVVLRRGVVGVAAELSWFRGIFSKDVSSYYARPAGLPILEWEDAISIMYKATWLRANEGYKISKNIRGSVSNSEYGSEFQLVVSKFSSDSNGIILRRLKQLHEILGGGELSVWNVGGNQKLSKSEPFMCDIWRSVLGGGVSVRGDL